MRVRHLQKKKRERDSSALNFVFAFCVFLFFSQEKLERLRYQVHVDFAGNWAAGGVVLAPVRRESALMVLK